MPDDPQAPPPTPEPPIQDIDAPLPGRPWNWLGEVRIALVFLTVLPVRLTPADLRFGVSHAVRAFPLAGLVVGAIAAAAFTLADMAGLASTIAALPSFRAGCTRTVSRTRSTG
jgi:hypothetical protein